MGDRVKWQLESSRLRTLSALLLLFLFCSQPVEAGQKREEFLAPAAPAAVSITASITPAEHALTLEECVLAALESNPLRRAAWESVRIAAGEVGQARAPFYPHLNASAGYQRFDRYVFLPGGVSRMVDSPTLGGADAWHAGVSLSYTLFDSGRRRAELEATQARLAASEQEVDSISHDLVLKVHEAYYRLLAGRQLEKASLQSLTRREENLRLAEIRLQAGDVTEVDVVRGRVEMANAQLALVRAQGEIYAANADLNAVMGLRILPPVAVREEDYGPLSLPPLASELPEIIDQAMARREILEAARWQIAAARHQVTVAQTIQGANLEATGSYGYRDEKFLPEHQEWLAGVTLRVPLFTGFAGRHQVAGARAELARSEAQLQDLELRIQREVVIAYARLLETYQAALTAENLVREARESLRLTRARYEEGEATINDLLDVEVALTAAETEHVQTFFLYHLATSRFQRTAGMLPLPGG